MKFLFLSIFLILGIGGFQKIAEMNARTQEAASAFREKRYAQAIKNYEYLVYEAKDKNPQLLLNLAHSYRLNQQADKAANAYRNCVKSQDPALRSVAWEQLGTLATKLQDYQQALTNYKKALVADPGNEQARYNYELLKKYLRRHPEKQNQPKPEDQPQEQQKTEPGQKQDQQQEQQQQEEPNPEGDQEKENPDQPEKGDQQQKPEDQPSSESKDKQDQPQAGDEGKEKPQPQGTENGNEKGENLNETEEKPQAKPDKKGGTEKATGNEQQLQTQFERLRKANISPEKAEMMLNAMRAAEQQYLQQLPKKGTKKRDPSKPDW